MVTPARTFCLGAGLRPGAGADRRRLVPSVVLVGVAPVRVRAGDRTLRSLRRVRVAATARVGRGAIARSRAASRPRAELPVAGARRRRSVPRQRAAPRTRLVIATR